MSNKQKQAILIPARNLVIKWTDAQRPLNEAKAREIAARFDWALFSVPTVGPVGDGTFHVCDGWTRVTAVKLRWGEEQHIACNVVQIDGGGNITKAEAARVFDEINTNRSRPTQMRRFIVRCAQGDTPEAQIATVCEKLGLKLSQSSKDGHVRAVGTLVKLHKQGGADHVNDVLSTVKATWGLDHLAYGETILLGLSELLCRHGDKIDRGKLAIKIGKKHTPIGLIAKARETCNAFQGGVITAVETLLANAYDNQLRTKRLVMRGGDDVRNAA